MSERITNSYKPFAASVQEGMKVLLRTQVADIIQEALDRGNSSVLPESFYNVRELVDFNHVEMRTPLNPVNFFLQFQTITNPGLWITFFQEIEGKDLEKMKSMLVESGYASRGRESFAIDLAQANQSYMSANTLIPLAALVGSGYQDCITPEARTRRPHNAAVLVSQQYPQGAQTGDELLDILQKVYPAQRNLYDPRTAMGALMQTNAFYAGQSDGSANKCPGIAFSSKIYAGLGQALQTPDYQNAFIQSVEDPSTLYYRDGHN